MLDTAGGVAIPAGSPAQLLVRSTSTGGAVHSAEVVLDLYSVTLGKKQYTVVTSDVAESNRRGVGANRRTAEYLGGGSALGALMGGLFGGGKGAGMERSPEPAADLPARSSLAGKGPGSSGEHSAVPPGKAAGVATRALTCLKSNARQCSSTWTAS